MKKKTKIKLATIIFAILSLPVIAHRLTPEECPPTPEPRPVSALVDRSRGNTTLPSTEGQIPQTVPSQNEQSNTQSKLISEMVTENTSTQPTEKETTDTTPIPNTQTATNPTTPPPTEPNTPKNGDTRIVNGQKQGYLLGFGWVDYLGENEVIYCEGMYESGNKIGVMD